MTGGGKDSCQTNNKGESASSKTSSPQSVDIQKIHAQMEDMEKENHQLMKDLEALKSKKN